ncbi:MAG: hypothetical protein OXQ89_16615 [Rhodospirillaceae bacterium]|nr:hypothetical protein [Rhodospirillaceae bacterium]
MSMAAAFDTLSAAKSLQAAGFAQEQAEAVAAAIRSGQGELATRQDVSTLRDELAGLRSVQEAQQAELGGLRADYAGLRADYAGLRAELGAIKWVLGLVAALNIAILVRLLLA